MDIRSLLILALCVLLFVSLGIIGYLYTVVNEPPRQTLAEETASEEQENQQSVFPRDSGLAEINLYYLNKEYTQLVAEKRTIHQPGTIAERIKIGVEELLKGPRSSDLRPTLPEGTDLQTVFWDEEEGRVYVVFTPDFLDNKPTHALAEWAMIYSVVSTVSGLSVAIQQVQIMCDGEIIDANNTVWDFSHPYEMNDTFLQYELSSTR